MNFAGQRAGFIPHGGSQVSPNHQRGNCCKGVGSPPRGERLAGSQLSLGLRPDYKSQHATRLEARRSNEVSGPRSGVCLRKASGHLLPLSAASIFVAILSGRLWNLLSPADSMVEHFREQPIGSQIWGANPASTRGEAGNDTKLL